MWLVARGLRLPHRFVGSGTAVSVCHTGLLYNSSISKLSCTIWFFPFSDATPDPLKRSQATHGYYTYYSYFAFSLN